jgi:hypothetical protein
MKSLNTLVVFATLFGSALAQAEMPKCMHETYSAQLKPVFVDRQLGWGKTGSIYVTEDRTDRTLSLTVERRFYCPPGRFCAMVMPAPITIELPIIAEEHDGCGTRVITAFVDRRPVDGDFEQIVLKDHTSDRCMYLRAVPATEVLYETESSGMGPMVKTQSSFAGEALHQNPVCMM